MATIDLRPIEHQWTMTSLHFVNIIGYIVFIDDHSRVKLLPMDEDDTSDYINANYIPVSNTLNILTKYFNYILMIDKIVPR